MTSPLTGLVDISLTFDKPAKQHTYLFLSPNQSTSYNKIYNEVKNRVYMKPYTMDILHML